MAEVSGAGEALRAAGELAKSVGRCSLALSALAVKQVGAVADTGTGASGPLQEVARAAADQLSGPLRTAFSVGVNLQSGLVDAMFDLAGTAPRGQVPQGDTAALAEPIPDRVSRGLAALRALADGTLRRPVPQPELVERVAQHRQAATMEAGDRAAVAAALWRCEGLGASIGRHRLAENSLLDARLPAAVQPALHMGFGLGLAEAVRFDAGGFKAAVEASCPPEWSGYAYDGFGAAARLLEPGLFKMAAGAVGVIPLDAVERPESAALDGSAIPTFSTTEQQWIAHGYGRVLAMGTLDIHAAISAATALPAVSVTAVVRGAGLTFALMHAASLPQVLAHSAVPFDSAVRAAFQEGLVEALVLMDWFGPGLLDAWSPSSEGEAAIVTQARHAASAAVSAGMPSPLYASGLSPEAR